MEPFFFGMGTMKRNTLRAQAGGDKVIFVHREDLSPGEPLEQALELLHQTGGRELGILSPARGSGDLAVDIVDLTKKGYIQMCGGLTQCLGKILGESSWIKIPGINITEGTNPIILETGAGDIPIEIILTRKRVVRVITDMTAYLNSCYQRGVSLIHLSGLTMASIGVNREVREFLVLDMKELEEEYSFQPFSFGKRETRLLTKLYQDFCSWMNLPPGHLYGALYRLENPGKARVLFPFYPWDGKGVEFACGTGSTAIAIALHQRGLLPDQKKLEMIHQVGLGEGGPITTLHLEGGKKLNHLRFSHKPLEIL